MTLTAIPPFDSITTNQPPATPPCGLNHQPTCRAKSETAHNLRHVYQKLGINTRVELTAQASRHHPNSE